MPNKAARKLLGAQYTEREAKRLKKMGAKGAGMAVARAGVEAATGKKPAKRPGGPSLTQKELIRVKARKAKVKKPDWTMPLHPDYKGFEREKDPKLRAIYKKAAAGERKRLITGKSDFHRAVERAKKKEKSKRFAKNVTKAYGG